MSGSTERRDEARRATAAKGEGESPTRKAIVQALHQLIVCSDDFKEECAAVTQGKRERAEIETTFPEKTTGQLLRCTFGVTSGDEPAAGRKKSTARPRLDSDGEMPEHAAQVLVRKQSLVAMLAPWLLAVLALAAVVVLALRPDSSNEVRSELSRINGRLETERTPVPAPAVEVKSPVVPEVKLPESLASDIAKKVVVPGMTAQEKTDLANSITQGVVAKLPSAPAVVVPKAAGEPVDVFVVVSHGGALDASQFVPAFQDAIVKRPRGKDERIRVGLILASNEQLMVKVRLDADAAAAKLDGIGKAFTDDAETLAPLGGKLRAEFKPDRGRRRCILVVSNGCAPLAANAPGWNEIDEVHVVLVARRELGDADKDRLALWHEFAAASRGSVTLVGFSSGLKIDQNIDRQNRLLASCLKRLIALSE